MGLQSMLLFGEGKMDGIFLNYLKAVYGDRERQAIKVARGQGGSPECVVTRMVKSELEIANYERSLLLIDSDLPIEKKTLVKLDELGVALVLSEPRCIEGLMLKVLDDLPKGARNSASKNLKRRFWKNHLKTDKERDALKRLNRGIGKLFPKKTLETARKTCGTLDELITFIEP